MLVLFSGIGCGPCDNVAPYFEKLSEVYGFDFYKTERSMSKLDDIFKTETPHIIAFPTFGFFRFGMELGKVVGDSPEQLKEWIELSIKYKGD